MTYSRWGTGSQGGSQASQIQIVHGMGESVKPYSLHMFTPARKPSKYTLTQDAKHPWTHPYTHAHDRLAVKAAKTSSQTPKHILSTMKPMQKALRPLRKTCRESTRHFLNLNQNRNDSTTEHQKANSLQNHQTTIKSSYRWTPLKHPSNQPNILKRPLAKTSGKQPYQPTLKVRRHVYIVWLWVDDWRWHHGRQRLDFWPLRWS